MTPREKRYMDEVARISRETAEATVDLIRELASGIRPPSAQSKERK